jgi:hypothetical protein
VWEGPSSCLSCRERAAVCRGCCPTCYRRYRAAVGAGHTTWAALESAGQVLPAQKAGETWMHGFRIGPEQPQPPVTGDEGHGPQQ